MQRRKYMQVYNSHFLFCREHLIPEDHWRTYLQRRPVFFCSLSPLKCESEHISWPAYPLRSAASFTRFLCKSATFIIFRHHFSVTKGIFQTGTEHFITSNWFIERKRNINWQINQSVHDDNNSCSPTGALHRQKKRGCHLGVSKCLSWSCPSLLQFPGKHQYSSSVLSTLFSSDRRPK